MTTTLKQTATFLAILFTLCIFSNINAQDIIYRTDGTAINATVTEVGDEDIKYVLTSAGNKVIFSLDLAKIEKIVFADGRVENFEVNIYAPTPQVFQRKNAVKMSFMGLLYGHTSIHYERRMQPGQSVEMSARIIGLGKNRGLNFGFNDEKRDARGLGVAVGYKFIKTPAQYKKGIRTSHLMRGAYLKPSLEAGYYGENFIADNTNNSEQTVISFDEPAVKRRNVGYYALMLGMGKQSVFSNRFVIDLNFGIGIAGDSAKGNYNTWLHNNFGHTRFGEGLGLALSGGVRIGFLF